MTLLDITGLGITFGGLRALDNFNLAVSPGELVGLIGPNGAGKTTIFNLITGVYRPDMGSIKLSDRELTRLKTYQITKAGISRTFQNIRLCKNLSVLDNVRIAYHLRTKVGIGASILRLPSFYREERQLCKQALELLALFNLHNRSHEKAGNLPYGDQRRLEIARALASSPKVLLLDEPAAGMNPQESQELCQLVRTIRTQFQPTILLIEHHMDIVMDVCDRILVLDYGQTIAQGTPDQIRRNPKVIAAYLGEEVG